jgi:hypothetical protein
LYFRDILADPIGAARRISSHFGIEISEQAEQRMRAWQV